MKPEFVEVKTVDGLTLPGLLYAPPRARSAVIYLHGNGSSSVFYNEKKNRPLAAALNGAGIAILYFNNRGAHIVKKMSVKHHGKLERRYFGTAYEKIKECVPDIDGAISFLKARGYKKYYLVGASTGANKICVYHFYKPKNKIAKSVLLCGGDDTGIYYHVLGRAKFFKLLREAKRKIKQKRGGEIITDPLLLSEAIFSYGGFYDIANPDGDYNVFPFYEAFHKKAKLSKKPLFRHFRSIKKPALVVYGDLDEFIWGDIKRVIATLRSYQPKFEYKVIKGANHGFKGRGRALAGTIVGWLRKN